jgi:hypothetical protein
MGGYYGIRICWATLVIQLLSMKVVLIHLLENYTKAIYADKRFQVPNLSQLQAYGGLRNGDGPQSAYSLWTGVGAQIGNYAYSDADQVSLNLDASLDILQGMKNTKRIDPIKHNIQFGLGYDQRTSRSYSLGASGLVVIDAFDYQQTYSKS